MSENGNENAKKTTIEHVIRKTLTGDAQKNALDYVAFLAANGIKRLPFENGWCYADGSVLYFDGGAKIPGPWTIWAIDVAVFAVDDALKAFAWSYANNCGCGAQPGLRKTLFGREFDHICTATLMFTNPDAATLSSIKKLALMNKRVKERRIHPVEKTIQSIIYQGCAIEVVERSDVLWVGCVDYACDNQGESDIGATLRRYREDLIDIPKRELINPDWSASLSINYRRGDKPRGIMFAQETYVGAQDVNELAKQNQL